MKKKKTNFDFYTVDEFIDVWNDEKRLVFIDTGIDEVVGLYEDIPDIIVDLNLKLGITDLSIYGFESGAKLLNTLGMFLDKCHPGVREDIIDRLVKLQTFEIKPKKYKLLTEETLQDFYEYSEGYPTSFDDPYTDEELNLMEKEYLAKQYIDDGYSFEEGDGDDDR